MCCGGNGRPDSGVAAHHNCAFYPGDPCGDVDSYRRASRALPKECNVGGVSAETGDVAVDPVKCETLVVEAAVCGEGGVLEEAEDVGSVVN